MHDVKAKACPVLVGNNLYVLRNTLLPKVAQLEYYKSCELCTACYLSFSLWEYKICVG